MTESKLLAEGFEDHRARLTAVAYRILGSASEADDAVQDTWLRLSRQDPDSIDNLAGWLTTVLSRVCLNTLQARRTQPEVPLDEDAPEPALDRSAGSDPEHEAQLSDAIGLALLVVLDALTPAERVAFVLHDMFGVRFDEIAVIVDRSAPAARQLASRARRRVRLARAGPETDRLRRAKLVDAFLAAARGGEFEQLLSLLDPDVVLRADQEAVELGVAPHTHGPAEVGAFSRRARGAIPALLDGEAAAVWIVGGEPRVVYEFTIGAEGITAIDLIADPARLDDLDLAPLIEP